MNWRNYVTFHPVLANNYKGGKFYSENQKHRLPVPVPFQWISKSSDVSDIVCLLSRFTDTKNCNHKSHYAELSFQQNNASCVKTASPKQTSQLSLVFKDIPQFIPKCMHVSHKCDDSDVLLLNSRNLRTINCFLPPAQCQVPVVYRLVRVFNSASSMSGSAH